MTGEGRDLIGPFLIRGKYNLDDGKCHWSKRYIGKHDVAYQGYNEGKGIWGLWEIPPSWQGGFHIWPSALGDLTRPTLAEAIDKPVELKPDFEELKGAEPIPVSTAPISSLPEIESFTQARPSPPVGKRCLAAEPAPQIIG
jgi:hypothetical protein